MSQARIQQPNTLGALTPRQARAMFRAGTASPTAGWAHGRVQANLITVPADWAQDLALFCDRNPKPCPVLDITEPGSWTTSLAAGADLRTDLPRYRVWKHGELIDEPTDITSVWREDLVSFLIGCSFSFESALVAAGIPLRHLEQGKNVSMYITRVECRPAGRLHGPMVVSMRPIPGWLVGLASQESGRLPQMHGAPIHSGNPRLLGIAGLARPDFGDAVLTQPGDVPVFWACGVTPQAALMASRPPFAITHAPGHMFITDAHDTDYRV